jgi:dUTP pyrophosphatase
MINFKIKLEKDGELPTKAHVSDAGWDLRSAEDIEILIGEREIVRCGFSIALPENYEAQIRPRSGLAIKHGITVLNSPGTVDQNYRGEIKIILINHGDKNYLIHKGERIAQMVIKQVEPSQYEIVDELDETDRNLGGFGSSGI